MSKMTLGKRVELYNDINSGIDGEIICDLYQIKENTLKKILSEKGKTDGIIDFVKMHNEGYTPEECSDAYGVSLTHVKTMLLMGGVTIKEECGEELLKKAMPRKPPKKQPKITFKVEGEDIDKIEFPENITITIIVKGVEK